MDEEKEIRIHDASGIYRVMYVARFEVAIYVLHCFKKKTQITGKQDKAIAGARYRALVNFLELGFVPVAGCRSILHSRPTFYSRRCYSGGTTWPGHR